jgi:hypothetical protein
MNALTKAAHDVLAERQRQISAEGWTPEHDDEHDDGSLAAAAACYAAPMATKGKTDTVDGSGGRGETAVWTPKRFVVPFLWPSSWHGGWWKPKDRRSNLVRAGALILAEIERLDRASGSTAASGVPVPAHSKSEYARRKAMGDPNVAPPAGVAATSTASDETRNSTVGIDRASTQESGDA